MSRILISGKGWSGVQDRNGGVFIKDPHGLYVVFTLGYIRRAAGYRGHGGAGDKRTR